MEPTFYIIFVLSNYNEVNRVKLELSKTSALSWFNCLPICFKPNS